MIERREGRGRYIRTYVDGEMRGEICLLQTLLDLLAGYSTMYTYNYTNKGPHRHVLISDNLQLYK